MLLLNPDALLTEGLISNLESMEKIHIVQFLKFLLSEWRCLVWRWIQIYKSWLY